MLSSVPQPCASIPGGLSDTALDRRPTWTECETSVFAWSSHRPRVEDWGMSLACGVMVSRRRGKCNDTETPLCPHSGANVTNFYYILVPGMASFCGAQNGDENGCKSDPHERELNHVPSFGTFLVPNFGANLGTRFGHIFFVVSAAGALAVEPPLDQDRPCKCGSCTAAAAKEQAV